MKRFSIAFMWLASLSLHAQSNTDRSVGGPCDECDLMFEGMPPNLSWRTTIAPPGEPGEPMIIQGTVYKKDGKTPAPDVILYIYHTDNAGIYSTAPGHTNRHGHLRGWIKTGADGRYEFKSIRPGSYPTRNAPAHIHPLIKEKGLTRYWIDEYLFEGDPLLTNAERARQEKRGGNGIITLKKNANGVWEGHRNIMLGMNVPNY